MYSNSKEILDNPEEMFHRHCYYLVGNKYSNDCAASSIIQAKVFQVL